MGDIVWAVDPRRDDFASLVARLRRFASDLLSEGGVALAFTAPPGANPRLRPELRREIYLTLKEAIHNAARHAAARNVTVRVAVEGDRLVGEVIDDGRGFVPGHAAGEEGGGSEGNGLRNMRQRAAAAGGSLQVESTPGRGTAVRLVVPLHGRGHRPRPTPGGEEGSDG
jgi:signal transduction histidine kinase